MSGSRDWFKHDAWFLADDKIRELGHEFGPAGPLVAGALMQLAKRQRDGGRVTVKWAYLAEHAFAQKPKGGVQKIVAAAAKLRFVEVERQDASEVVLVLPKWQRIQGAGLSGAERTANWRARQGDDDPPDGDGPVTSHERHETGDGDSDVTLPSRASAQEVEKEKEAKASFRRGKRAEEKANEDDQRLCRLLAEFAKGRNPKFKVRSRSRWLTDMRLLRERDGNEPAEIEQALRWAFTDTCRDAQFWADVIQSPGNLREHFPQIWAKMQAAPRLRAVAGVEDSAAYLARKGAA